MAIEPTTITLPLGVRTTRARTTHFGEVKHKDAKHLGTMLVLDNQLFELLGRGSDLTITITADWSEPFKLPEPAKPTKAAQQLLDRHAKLRAAHSEAYAAVESSDVPQDSAEAKRLTKRRDTAFAKLAPVAAKLREAGYELDHDDSEPTRTA